MVFSGIAFLFYFLPLCLGLYFIVPRKFRNAVLFVFSIVFYAWGEPVYIFLMLFSILFNYMAGLLLERFKYRERLKRLVLIISVIVDLGMLGVFKYSGFVVENLNSLLGTSIAFKGLALPIGISFYTFQIMSYTIDVYRGKVAVQRNILDLGTYLALFPQLIAGPIVRYETVEYELHNRKETLKGFSAGVIRFIIGLGKKVLLANGIGQLWTAVSASADYCGLPVLTAWLGIIAYTFQIYFDFSGYSDMAIGMGKMFGFNFLENFNYPYIAKSATDFWRRWHISLSTWFKDYVYIPLGGNRVPKPRWMLNIAIVWLLTGLWHGASWNFVLWGCFYGFLLINEKLWLGKLLDKVPDIVCRLYSFLFITVGWALFAIEDLNKVIAYIGAMFGSGKVLFTTQSLFYLKNYAFIFVLCLVCSMPIVPYLKKKMGENVRLGKLSKYAVPIFAFAVLFICIAYLVDATYNPFLYFRF